MSDNRLMLDTRAAELFLIVASISVVLLTVLFCVLAFFIIRAVRDVRSLAQRLSIEVERFTDGRRRLLKNVRFARRWVELFFTRINKDEDKE